MICQRATNRFRPLELTKHHPKCPLTITTGTIVVIIDYDWVYYFLYFFCILFLYFPKPIKTPT